MWKLFVILGACLAVAFFAAFVWQQTEKNSREDEANKHDEIATNLEAAVADGLGAGTTLSEYVQTGNPELLPVMQAKSDEGVRQLTAAITAAGSGTAGFRRNTETATPPAAARLITAPAMMNQVESWLASSALALDAAAACRS